MARGVNRVILVGNLGADPEIRHTASGMAITSLRLATSESWKDKQTGEALERTEWHRVKLFGALADIAAKYLRKGRQVYIEGSLRTEKYTDKQGIERYSTDVLASEMQMLGSEGKDSGDGATEHHQRSTTTTGDRPSRDKADLRAGHGSSESADAGNYDDWPF